MLFVKFYACIYSRYYNNLANNAANLIKMLVCRCRRLSFKYAARASLTSEFRACLSKATPLSLRHIAVAALQSSGRGL